MGLKVVTYEGSDNPGETVFYVGDSRLNKGTPTAIPDADAALVKELLDDEEFEHAFKIGNAAPKHSEHGSIVVDGKAVGIVNQPVPAEADEADEPEPSPATS